MPVELPGFYFDTSRNRYFPLSSKLKDPLPQPVPVPISDDYLIHSRKRRRISSWHSNETTRTSHSIGERYQASHDFVCSQYANTTRVLEKKVPVFGRIKSFSSMTLDGNTHRFIGDSRGWLYSSAESESVLFQADVNLQPESEVSSISTYGARCIATSFGPSAKIAVQDLNMTGRISLLSLTGLHDIWSSHFEEASLVLGVSTKAVYMSDIDAFSVQHLETHSDVFAVRQHGTVIFAGCRNGNIMQFDKRLGKRGQKLHTNRFSKQQRTSVLHLEMLTDWQVLTSYMNGGLMTFDLRFTREGSPLVQYHGHHNTYTQRLGIAIDPSHEFLFAAGEDRRIRAWSVHTGRPLISSSSHDDMDDPFNRVFPGVVETMQVTAEREGLCLWAGHDQTLYQIYLGQQ
ncbi:Dual specificity phosphatase ibp1 [Termitomyces sp. T112]|nr:Dual specificity phosphatase ibp1 [Termitomyces sp. T112]